MKIYNVKLHKISLVSSQTQLSTSRFESTARNKFKNIVEDTSLSFDQLLEKFEDVINNSNYDHKDYPRENTLINLPNSIKDELVKLNLPSIYITISIQYSDGTGDNDIVIWNDLNGVKKDILEQMKNKESISLKQKVLVYDKEYEEHYMV